MSESTWSRREVLRAAFAACGAFVVPGARNGVLRLGLVLPPGEARGPEVESALRGVTLGVEEAARTAALLGRGVELRTAAADEVERLAGEDAVAALLGGFDEPSCRMLAGAAEAAGVPFLNLGCASDALRRACQPATFHVEASAAMYADALAKHAAGDSGAGLRAVLWHPTLERFGAAQLNDRFRARFRGEMDGPAWAGWMAVKLLWEASLRARAADRRALGEHLVRPATRFDGHKGWPLSFRPADRQLRQPLYLVAGPEAGGRLVGEVPVRPGGGGTPSHELLDRLGGDTSTSTCPRTREGEP